MARANCKIPEPPHVKVTRNKKKRICRGPPPDYDTAGPSAVDSGPLNFAGGGVAALHREQMNHYRHAQLTDSATTIVTTVTDRWWLDDAAAWDHFCSVLTSLYALFIIVFAVVVELSQKFTPDEWFSETLFYSYMYGAGVVFLAYCYLFKVYPAWFNALVRLARRHNWIGAATDWHIVKTSHMGEGAGSLYLRLGTLCFGSSGIVLFCLEIFMCLSDRHCFTYQLVNWVFSGLFMFIQMHFIFCNSKIIIVKSKNLTKLGAMHLLAVNIWTWLRFVIAKNAALERPRGPPPIVGAVVADVGSHRILFDVAGSSSTSSSESTDGSASGEALQRLVNTTAFAGANASLSLPSAAWRAIATPPLKVSSFDYFGDFATLLTTSIVEYSVIGAAIMIVLWRSIDEHVERSRRASAAGCVLPLAANKRKHKVRIDCSASSGGLFAGLLFMICAFVSIGIHSFFSQHCDSHGALLVFRLSDMALFCVTLVGCSIAIYRMRPLQYHQQRSSSAEFLDELLLVIGLVGELIHSSTGVMCWFSTQSERAPMESYMLLVFITRIVQVVVQAIFILLARRLRTLSEEAVRMKPGKQFVTFLLIANVSLFFFHTLEGMKSVFGENISSGSRRQRPYASLIVGVAPLIVFYRFHSSVCLAEIWKHCYNVKNRQTASAPIGGASEATASRRVFVANEEPGQACVCQSHDRAIAAEAAPISHRSVDGGDLGV